MLRPESIASLRCYTSLPNQIQGIIQRTSGDFEVSKFITSDTGFQRILRRTSNDFFCCARCTLHASLDDPGTPVSGTIMVAGTSVVLEGGDVAAVTGTLLKGIVEGHAIGDAVFITAKVRDVLHGCRSPGALFFGVSTTTGPLVPSAEYLEAVINRKLRKCLVASPAGMFILTAVPPAEDPQPSPLEAIQLIKNLLDVDLVVQIGEAPTTIYRLASNCVIAGPDFFEESLRRIQSSLDLPFNDDAGIIPTTSSAYRISRTMLRTMSSYKLSEERVRQSQVPGATVYVEPLSGWQSPSVTITLNVSVTAIVGQPTTQSLSFTDDVKGGELRFKVRIGYLDFRPLRPGETAAALITQLRSVVQNVLDTQVDSSVEDQAALDKTASAFSTALQGDINKADLFSNPMLVSLSIDQAKTAGQQCRLPSGKYTTIPAYALTGGSIRMSAYIGTLTAVGVSIRFRPWDATGNGVYI